MKTKTLYILGIALLLILILALGYWLQKQRPVVVLERVGGVGTFSSSPTVTFQIRNQGRHLLQFPNTWSLHFEDGTVEDFQLDESHHFRIEPGQTATFAMTNPATTQTWRLGAQYYPEDMVFNAKVAMDGFVVSNAPAVSRDLFGVQGRLVMSDWIEEPKGAPPSATRSRN